MKINRLASVQPMHNASRPENDELKKLGAMTMDVGKDRGADPYQGR
jgi:hypothetical protein